FSTLALGSMREDSARHDFVVQLGLDPARLTVISKAVHGVDLLRVDRSLNQVTGCDGLITAVPGLSLMALFADCRPLILYATAPDRETGAVALCHAGWQGAARGMAKAGVAALTREYGCQPSEIKVGIGPGICADCYEVGPEVSCLFPDSCSRASRDDRRLLDLVAVHRLQLIEAGVLSDQIFVHPACTKESPELPSHRGNPDGIRFACLVALRDEGSYRQMLAEGRITPAEAHWSTLPKPRPLRSGERPLSEVLADMRADER
ncbi:MAG: polyphenol oxidase family protein, partial [Candidatus Dormibacteraceae bacterium]